MPGITWHLVELFILPLMPVYDDRVLNFIIQSASSGSNLRRVELCVDFVPNLTSSGYVSTPSSLSGRSSIPQRNMPEGPNRNMPAQKNPSNTSDSFPTQNQMNANLNANLESNSSLSNESEDIISAASLSDSEYIQNDESEDEFSEEIEEEREEERQTQCGRQF